jgi:hypothetical protein
MLCDAAVLLAICFVGSTRHHICSVQACAVCLTMVSAGAMMGALHGTSWLPQQWLDNLENASKPPRSNHGKHKSFFNNAAADALLAGGAAVDAPAGSDGSNAAASVAAGGGDGDVVLTTRDMGRDAVMQLARLLAQLDCRTL